MLRFLSLLLLPLLFFGCPSAEDDMPTPPTGEREFDRRAMLAGWADDYHLQRQRRTLDALQRLRSTFLDGTLETVRSRFLQAYVTWQGQAPYILADGEALRLREQTNTYPTNTEEVASGYTGALDLTLPSLADAQGFPALEYLLYGGEDEGRPPITADAGAKNHAIRLTDRLIDLHTRHLTALEDNRDAYVANDGSSATASIDRTVNDYIFYYEKFLRAGKVGIPAGVFSDDPLADRAESFYAGRSKTQFLRALTETRDFFVSGGLLEYLDFVENTTGEKLSGSIRAQFSAIEAAAADVDEDFSAQVRNDNVAMLRLYDELQKLTVLLKVDMLQTLNINVDYVDADGD